MRLLTTALLLAFAGICLAQVDPSKVNFMFYSRDNMDLGEQAVIGDIQEADYKPWKNTTFIIHGFEENADKNWVILMKLYTLVAHDNNVFVVDWREPAGGFHGGAATRSHDVGQLVGDFISFIASLGQDLKGVNCVGFGIGAHVCGFAGKVHPVDRIARVTGLDPDRHDFNYDDPADRIAATDADFVDVIHTCGGDAGIGKPLGLVDFYPNNGGNQCDQNGCGLIIDDGCSHHRAHKYWTESLLTVGFEATKCSSWSDYKDGLCDGNEKQPMGDRVSLNARGEYFLHTHGHSPFAMIDLI